MREITIALTDDLYMELEEAATATREHGFTPAMWAGELVSSELAARRLPRVTIGSHGPRIGGNETEVGAYRVLLPSRRRMYA